LDESLNEDIFSICKLLSDQQNLVEEKITTFSPHLTIDKEEVKTSLDSMCQDLDCRRTKDEQTITEGVGKFQDKLANIADCLYQKSVSPHALMEEIHVSFFI
jgi:hypothetical protein